MLRRLLGLALCLLFTFGPGPNPGQGQEVKKEVLKSDAKKGVFVTPEDGGTDYALQGEFTGTIADAPWGAQVVARGEGKFEVYFLAGGLPGANWDLKTRSKVDAKTVEGKTTFESGDWKGSLTADSLSGSMGKNEFKFKRATRSSPTIGAKPPEGAVVLFDGKSIENWTNGKVVDEKHLFCGTTSMKKYAIGKLHLEFRTPFQPKAKDQGRGNSGVYLNGDEIQVLDSFGLKGENNECGGFYGKRKPVVNMCLPPLVWQTYDVTIEDDDGKLLATVEHNGVLIHSKHPLGTKPDAPFGINLQNHSNPVVYRNIWLVERK